MSACGACGASVPEDALHCPSCGVRRERSPGIAATAPGSPVSGALDTPAAKPTAKSTTVLATGTVVDGKYAILRVLGQGGMGVVYLARDVHTGIEVVLKAVRPELSHRQDVRNRTLAEGRALAKIDHPNVVHLNAVVAQGPSLWLVMQYIDGESVDKTIKRYRDKGEPMPWPWVKSLFEQVLAGVGAAHAEGVIHRDLKPANILIRAKDDVAKVTDFGIAKPEKQARAGKGDTKGIIGSLWYMSPEQVRGQRDLDKRLDIYALGILLFELLCGRVPFDAESSYDLMKMHTEAPLPRLSELRPDAPPGLQELLDRACAKDRDQRFPDCEQFLAALRAIGGSPEKTSTQEAAPLFTEAARAAGAPVAKTLPGSMPSPEPQEAAAAPSEPPPAKAGSERPPPASAAPASAPAESEPAGETAPAASMTTPDSAAPEAARAGGNRALWVVLAVAIVGGGAALAISMGWIPVGDTKPVAPPPPVTVSAPAPEPPGVAESAPAPEEPAPLAKLEGRWRSEAGKDFDAVSSGDRLEFRVVDPAQLGAQGYLEGEARFVLRAVEGETSAFAIDDLIRPKPPEGDSYAKEARTACHIRWSEADGRPLRATFDGTRLTVEFAKIEPTLKNFRQKGGKVVDCMGLQELKPTVVQSVLTRVDD